MALRPGRWSYLLSQSTNEMEIKLSANALRRWKRAALRGYPNEVYGVLLGVRRKLAYHIKDIWVPREQDADPGQVFVDPEWYGRSKSIADRHGWMVIGSIHTHPYNTRTVFDPVQSIGDIEGVAEWESLIGIMNVYGPRATGGRRRCDQPHFYTKTLLVPYALAA